MTKLAVVGCGYWGPNLARNFESLENCQVAMICDRDEGRLAHMKHLHPLAEITTSVDKVTANPEIRGVAVATPVRTHYPIAMQCLKAGKHVFVEKPMAASVRECAEMAAQARAGGVQVMVGHTFVYAAAVRRIKEIIQSGEIGEVLYIASRRLNLGLFQKDVSVAWDLAPHDISIILYVTGKTPLTVNCQGSARVRKDLHDVMTISMQFEDGAFATVHSSWIDPLKIRETTIVGSKKMIVYNDNEPLEKLRIYDKRVEIPPHYDTFAEFHYSYHYGDMQAPYLKQYEPLRLECQTFLDCIRTGSPSESGAEEGMKVVQVLEAAETSLHIGGSRVQLNGHSSGS
jgi:predicted dehydrogenase